MRARLDGNGTDQMALRMRDTSIRENKTIAITEQIEFYPNWRYQAIAYCEAGIAKADNYYL